MRLLQEIDESIDHVVGALSKVCVQGMIKPSNQPFHGLQRIRVVVLNNMESASNDFSESQQQGT